MTHSLSYIKHGIQGGMLTLSGKKNSIEWIITELLLYLGSIYSGHWWQASEMMLDQLFCQCMSQSDSWYHRVTEQMRTSIQTASFKGSIIVVEND